MPEGQVDPEGALAEAIELGLDVTGLARAVERFEGVWEMNVPAVMAFLAISSQWVDQSLDYARAEAGLRLAGIDAGAELWAEIRLIEQGAAEAIREARA